MRPFRIPARTLSAIVAAAFAASGYAQTQSAPRPPLVTLKVGDSAPPLAVSGWLKGTPVTNLADGKVHVVEFWATWCGPCKGSMPHLSEVARRFRGKVDVIGVDVFESSHGGPKDPQAIADKSKSFVGYAGDMMDYNVATDTADGTMANTWLKAAGQNGIPCSFVIDQQGKIAWIGHPLFGLGDVVDLVEKRQYTAATGEKIAADWQKRFDSFSGVWSKYNDALNAKNYAKATEYVDQAEKLLPGLGSTDVMRLSVLMQTDRPAARELAEKALREYPNDPQNLFQLASTIAEASGVTKEDGKVAVKLAVAAAKRYAPSDPLSLSVLAEAYHAVGDDAKAAGLQKQYLAYLGSPERGTPQALLDQEKAKLKTYQTSSH